MSETMLNELLTGWEHAYISRVVIGAVGATVAVLAVRSLIRSWRGWIAAVLWLLAGGVAVGFALAPDTLIRSVISTEHILRIRAVFALTSIVVLLVTFDSVRRHHLAERYALLWVATGLVLLFVSLFPAAVDLLRAATGLEFGSAMAALAFIFLVLVAFHFSLSLSATRDKQVHLAQRIAILESDLREALGAHRHDRRHGAAEDGAPGADAATPGRDDSAA